MNPDLRSACVAYLLAQSSIVSAFTATAATPKFWSDWEGPNNQESYLGPPQFSQSLPYCVLMIPQATETYETEDENGNGTSVVEGILIAAVFAAGRTLADELADQVGIALNDAPLVFGPYTAGAGQVTTITGSNVVTFSQGQGGLAGYYLVVTGDTSNGVYLVKSGGGTTWMLIEPFEGEGLGGATWGTTNQALFYFRRTERTFPVVTAIGPDGSPVSTPSYAQFKFFIEKVNGPG